MGDLNQNQGQWLKLHEAAYALGVSEITLRRKIKSGRIAHELRDGKYYVFVDPALSFGDTPPNLPTSPKTTTMPQRSIAIASESKMQANKVSDGHWARRVSELETQLRLKDEMIVQLKREFEDQQTLISFLEERLQDAQTSTKITPVPATTKVASAASEAPQHTDREGFPYRII